MNKKFKSFLILPLLIFISENCLFGQSVLRGKVIDKKNNLALTGASVYVPDLKVGSVTKADGSYEIKNIPKGTYLLEVSFVGYASEYKEIVFKEELNLDFALRESSAESPEVVVTGVSSATEQRSNPVPVSFITCRHLLEVTSNNIIDALSFAPGVSQITMGPAISKPVIRGLGYNRVVVVNDGIRQEGQQFGDEFGIEIDPYTVDKIEIMRGPATLSYGSDAMAGVINMIAAPILSQGQIKGNILATYQTNNGLYGGSGNIAGNQNGITWDVRYTYLNARAYKNKYDGYVFNSGYGENNFEGSVGVNRRWGYSRLTLSSFNLKLGVVEGGRDEETGLFNRHVMASDGEDSTVIVSNDELKSYGHDLIIHQHVRHYKAVLDNSFSVGNGHLGVRLGFQQNHRQEANDATLGDEYNIYFHLNTFNYDIRYSFPEKNHFEFSFGTNGMQQSSQNKGSVFLVPEYHLFDLGLFTITKKTFDKLTLSGGLRFDNRTLHGDDLFIDSGGRKLSYPKDESIHRFTAYNSDFRGISGSLGISYDFSESFYGKLNVSKSFRAPNIAESGSNGIHDGTAEWFHFNNTFSMLRTIQKDQGDSTKYLPYNPPTKLVSGVEFIAKKLGVLKSAYFRADLIHCFRQDKIYYKFGDETVTPAYTLLNLGVGADICSKTHTLFSLYIYASNITNAAYQSNMSRLKYTDLNTVTGRIGVYEMGRDYGIKLLVPVTFRN